MPKQKVIIIGAGIGGLGTAGLFAKKGYDVTVFEKNANLGGRANIFEADGFKFDMGPSWYLAPDLFEHFFISLFIVIIIKNRFPISQFNFRNS